MNFFIFEIKYWLRQPMVYIFFAINALLVFGATYSDNIQIGGSFGNIAKNAPFVIQKYYSIMSFITLLMTTSFILASTIRDFANNTYQILFTTPLKRASYLLGRFFGAITIAVIPLLGVSLGIIIGCLMPDMDPEKIGPIYWEAHLAAIYQLAIPNTLFSGAVVFMIAALTRNTIAAFIGSLILLLVTGIAGAFARDLNQEWLAILMDPYGTSTFTILTKYWTVSQKNNLVLPLVSLYLYNRLLWLGISSILVFITVKLFSFTEKASSPKKKQIIDETVSVTTHHHQPLPAVNASFTASATRIMLWKRIRYEISGIIKSPAFIVLLIAGLMNFLPSLIISRGGYGLSTHPVTYDMIDTINGSFYIFLIAIIIIYSGQLVWRERESKFDEIYDTTPHPTWITYLSKFVAMALVIFIVQLVCILTSITVQLSKGFTDIRPEVYIDSILIIDFSGFLLLVVIAMFLHSLINNKYLAFFAFVIFLVLNSLIWSLMEVESNMVQYGSEPSYTYSDMNGFGPFIKGIFWFRMYWALFAVVLALISIFAWARGKELSLKSKLGFIFTGIRSRTGKLVGTFSVLWIITAGFVYYNTQFLNTYKTSDEYEKLQVFYEKSFKKYEGINQPRATGFVYNIDLFPEERRVAIKGSYWAQNKGTTPIDSVHFSLLPDFESTIRIRGARRVENHRDVYRIYKLRDPLLPGDSIEIEFTADYIARGFENEVRFTSIVDNGSFFNNIDFTPQIGYQPSQELQDRDKRKKNGLKEIQRMPALERDCNAHCKNNYLSNNADWVNVETYFSTSGDQLAIAPGSLVKEWKKDGRNYYHYKLDHKSVNFYSFISARFNVLKTRHNGIDVEVYYDSKHTYNIDKMEKSMQKSLDYYITNYGPYYHKQVRIIEFPRYASFAQAFPGTMPYSEGIGFIAKIEDEEDIDMVFYVVAHEMGHQYWAHQVMSAEMQGATMLTETFAQYSALMVMEKEYGRNAMKKFLKYEMDNYLRARGTERLKELPLMKVENQGYIHYRKGSLVMYYLREMIGEENVNKSLRKIITEYAYQEPPYPVSHVAVDAFRENTPDSLKYIIADLFETITLYNNRTKNVTSKELKSGKYELTIEFSSQKFRADSLGKETEIPVNDWIEVGVFGKPEGNKKTGPVLYRQKHHITRTENTIKLLLDKKPFEAGIDPMNLMVDVVSDDNIKEVVGD